MRIPKHIMIKGEKWVTKYKWNLKNDKGDLLDGMCCLDTRTIFLDRSLPKEERPQVYLHEIIHALLYELHMHLIVNDDTNELLSENLSQFIMKHFSLRLKKK